MIRNLKVLGLALCAIFALSATMASGASALSIFDAATTPTILESTSENTQKFVRSPGTSEETKIECTHAQFKGTQIGTSVEEVSLSAEYTTPTCSGPLGTEVHVDFTTNGCGYTFKGTASKTASSKLFCTGGTGVLLTPTLFGSSVCTITVPPQTTGGHVVFTNYTEGALKSVTAEATASAIESTRTGSSACGPVKDTSATYTGNTKITGYDDNAGVKGAQHNIEVT